MKRRPNRQKRPNRLTPARYRQSAEWLHHWPRRWLFFGPRMMPVAIFLEAMARADHTRSKTAVVLQGKIHDLQRHVSHLERSAKRTQDYITEARGRLDQAAADNLTVATFLERDRARARAHWDRGDAAVVAAEGER